MKQSAKPAIDAHTLTLGVDTTDSDVCWILQVIDGPDRGARIPLGDGSSIVGSGSTADLRLNDPGVSRRHLEVALVHGGARVVDLGSKNGTSLLGARLSVATVGVGAELRLGNTTLRIDDAEAVADAVEAERLGVLSTTSTPMRRLFGALLRVAPTDVAVLLEGEPGTGKSVVARALHRTSARAARVFESLDLGVLVEAEVAVSLFGGIGPTGTPMAGAFERAHGGTLLLQSIETVALQLQPALARAIEAGVIERVLPPGAPANVRRTVQVNVRVLVTTTKDLDAEVRAGRLRAELRDAAAVVRVMVPPLRERLADLPELCRDVLTELGCAESLDPDTLARLQGHRWPGNLRELKHTLARAMATSSQGGLQVSIDAPASSFATLRDQKDQFERDALEKLLEKHGGNVSAAARAAGIDRRHLYRLLNKHGLRGG